MLPTLPAHIATLIHLLAQHGHEAYLVGGSLRDFLRGEVPHDYDLTTSALPEQTLAVFSPTYTVLPTGLQHGTVTVLVPTGDDRREPVEITTYRVDGTYTDARHPDRVTFTSNLREDLARRDFTVNAMAWDGAGGIVDPFGGQNDLSQGILRAVGDPEARFREDALRILRGFRFAAQLNFQIEPGTLTAMANCRAELAKISAERIFAEFLRLLVAPAADRALSLMADSGVLPFVLPEVARSPRLVSRTVARRMNALPPDFCLRLAYLAKTSPREALAADLAALKVSRHVRDDTLLLHEAQSAPLPDTLPAARRYLIRYGEHTGAILAALTADGTNISDAQALLDKANATPFCHSPAELALSGDDLLALGLTGKQIGTAVRALFEHVLDHPEANTRQALIAWLQGTGE